MSTSSCVGIFFRGYNSVYFTGTEYAQRKGFRLLKRKSCSGCERCDGLLSDVLPMERDASNEIGEIKDGALYKLHTIWYPGPYEYPEDGDLQVVFKEVK